MNNINEHIKILEDFIKYFEAEAVSRKYRRNISITVGEDDIEALENLIKAYKELEKNYINPSKARISYYDTKKGTEVVIEGFVPKSLIKEKIDNKIIALKNSHIDNILKSEFKRLRDELLGEEK